MATRPMNRRCNADGLRVQISPLCPQSLQNIFFFSLKHQYLRSQQTVVVIVKRSETNSSHMESLPYRDPFLLNKPPAFRLMTCCYLQFTLQELPCWSAAQLDFHHLSSYPTSTPPMSPPLTLSLK